MRQLFSSLPTQTHKHTRRHRVVACLPRSTATEASWQTVPTAAPAAKLLASPPNANLSLNVVAGTPCVFKTNNSKGLFHTKEDTTGLVFGMGRLLRCLWPRLAFAVRTLPRQTMHSANLRSPECSFWLRE